MRIPGIRAVHDREPHRSAGAACRSALGARRGAPALATVRVGTALALVVALCRRGRHRRGAGRAAACPSILATILKWTPLLAQRLRCSTSRSASSPWRSAPRSACCSGSRRSRCCRRCAASSWFVTQFFRNSPWLVLLFYCMFLLPFEVRDRRHDHAAAGLAQGDHRPLAAGDGERVRDRARRGAARSPTAQWEAAESLAFIAAPDAVDDHPAAMREAHAAAVDEPLRDPHRRRRRSPRSSASAR